MCREEQRKKKALEKNPIEECNKIMNNFYPTLFQKFSDIDDPRNQGYVKYTNPIMFGTIFYKNIGGIISMQDMNDKFNNEAIAKSVSRFCGVKEKEFLPDAVT